MIFAVTLMAAILGLEMLRGRYYEDVGGAILS